MLIVAFQEDEEPLPNDELPEHLRKPPPVDFSKASKDSFSLNDDRKLLLSFMC